MRMGCAAQCTTRAIGFARCGPDFIEPTCASVSQAVTHRSCRVTPLRSKQIDERARHRPAQLVGIEQRDRAPVIAPDVVADADRRELDAGMPLEPRDDRSQVPLEIRWIE
jgi:hypothetical protein